MTEESDEVDRIEQIARWLLDNHERQSRPLIKLMAQGWPDATAAELAQAWDRMNEMAMARMLVVHRLNLRILRCDGRHECLGLGTYPAIKRRWWQGVNLMWIRSVRWRLLLVTGSRADRFRSQGSASRSHPWESGRSRHPAT